MLHQGCLFVVLLTSTRFFTSTSSAVMAEGIPLGSPQGDSCSSVPPQAKAFFDMLYKIIGNNIALPRLQGERSDIYTGTSAHHRQVPGRAVRILCYLSFRVNAAFRICFKFIANLFFESAFRLICGSFRHLCPLNSCK